MKLKFTVNPNSKEEKIEKLSESEYKAFFKVAPENGQANQKLIEMAAEYFDVPKSKVYIVFGSRSKQKLLEIIE